ncbi:MAG TPA: DUF6512 family protein [Longimicrobiales bacterium]
MTSFRARVLGSTLVVVTAGSLLHFAWEWSGRDPVVAVFAATNESTWEHLKMAFWPALLLSPLQRLRYGRMPGLLPATAIRSLLPPVLIVALFHGYTWILGSHHLAADIATFVVAVFTGELLGHGVMARSSGPGARVASAMAVTLAVIAFATLSFVPPDWFLFDDPTRRGPGAATGVVH